MSKLSASKQAAISILRTTYIFLLGIYIAHTMPRRRRTKSRKSTALARRRRGGARRHGGSLKGFLKFVGKAGSFLHKTKLISRAGKIGSMLGMPLVGDVGRYASKFGLGRKRTVRRRRRGKGTSLAGGGVYLAGRGRKKNMSASRGISY
jgi:hypothetical protein